MGMAMSSLVCILQRDAPAPEDELMEAMRRSSDHRERERERERVRERDVALTAPVLTCLHTRVMTSLLPIDDNAAASRHW